MGLNIQHDSLILVLASCLLLTACGKKGPLYLPDDTQKTEQRQAKENNT
ncbi:MAG: hypothetical protein BMS9Abin36_0351 [Gammaproteobacteria bacterium]|nr:MAG: hypothetical protein BMS9Abin36_0351 [Gammaproteobacteria bacterium]